MEVYDMVNSMPFCPGASLPWENVATSCGREPAEMDARDLGHSSTRFMSRCPTPSQLGGVRARSGLDAVCSRLDPGCIRALNRAKHTSKKPDHPSGKIAWCESVHFRGVRVSCQTKSQLPRVGFPFVSANRNMTRCLLTSVVFFVLVMHLLCIASFLAAPFIKL